VSADDWRVESDGVGELHVFCPECWRREFGVPGSSCGALLRDHREKMFADGSG